MVRRKYQTLDMALDRILEESGKTFSRRDHALISALTYGVMRRRAELDWMIAHFSRTPLSKIDPPILNILRLGVYQIRFMDRIPVSAAVNTAVEMAKTVSGTWVVRFVNGLLRNVARQAEFGFSELPYPDFRKDPIEALAVQQSFPKWLLQRWTERYGIMQTNHLCQVINQIPPITLRANTLRTKPRDLLVELATETRHIRMTVCSRVGISFDHPQKPVFETKAFKNGWFQVQDEAAQLIAPFLNPTPAERILDACAGLGGKTAHIAQLMHNKGEIVALDHADGKLKKLKHEMQRLGITIVHPLVMDLNHPIDVTRTGVFDRVLLDAPCSGLGVIRRNPDSKWSESKKNLARYHERQCRFLHHVAPLVKPQGMLVFAVCSMEPEENEQVVKKFLKDHPEFDISRICGNLSADARLLVDHNGFLRTCPHLNDMDGFFAACFQRIR
jgi:16S rRNA (cytosine967-C5)-methyltransferase